MYGNAQHARQFAGVPIVKLAPPRCLPRYRVADEVVCKLEPDRDDSNSVFLPRLVPGMRPDPRPADRFNGLDYFANRPLGTLRYAMLVTLHGVGELADAILGVLNLVFCVVTVFFSGSAAHGLRRRVFLIAPIRRNALFSAPPLLQRGVPSMLARFVPLWPVFLLQYALAGVSFRGAG
jgi:hypothetical protein